MKNITIKSICTSLLFFILFSIQGTSTAADHGNKKKWDGELTSTKTGLPLDSKNELTAAPVCLFDSTTIYVINTPGIWDLVSRRINYYNLNNIRDSILFKTWNGFTWDKNTLTVYTYDSNNFNDWVFSLSWNGLSWDSMTRSNYDYDSGGNLHSLSTEGYGGGNWDSTGLQVWTYDANFNVIVYLERNDQGLGIDNYWLETYSYDVNNNRIASESKEWDGSNWMPVFEDSFWYNINNSVDTHITWTWNSNHYEYEVIRTYTYNAHNLITSEISQRWYVPAWENFYKDTFEYDLNDNMTRYAMFNWDGTSWVLRYNTEYDYCTNNCQSYILDYDVQGGIATKQDSISTHCSFYSGIEEEPLSKTLNVYPNPNSSGKIKIEVPEDNSSIYLLNMFGEIIREWSSVDKGVLDAELNELASGVYIMKLITKNNVVYDTRIVQFKN